MPEGIQKEYQEILHQIHSDVFLERLKDHLDSDGRTDFLENDASDLLDLARRLIGDDVPALVDDEVIQKLLEDSEIRDDLLKATRSLMKHQSKEV